MKLYRKLIAVFLTVLFLFLSPEPFVSASKGLQLIDCFNDESYTVKIDNTSITIEGDNYYGCFETQNDFHSCSVYNGNFSFLGYTLLEDNSYQTVILNIDTAANAQKSFALKVQASDNIYNFTTDKSGFCYFTDKYNYNKLYCCSQRGIVYSLEADAPIRQLLCIDGDNITVITYDGVYSVTNSALYKTGDELIDVPCNYTKDGIVISQSGTEYYTENGELISVTSESTSEAEETENFSDIIVLNDFYIIPRGTTVAKLRKALNSEKDELSVSKADGSSVSSGKLGTGMIVSQNTSKRFVIIKGELTGEGNINSRDLKLMMKYITSAENPTRITQNAADINCDGVISTKDLLMLANMY